MEVRVLGPVEVWHDGQQIRLVRRQQRLLIGILSMAPGQLISSDRLIELLWGETPPATARAVVQSRISELRATLIEAGAVGTDAHLVTHRSGYTLQIRSEAADAHCFHQLVTKARHSDSDAVARDLLRGALDLWRGPAFGGLLAEHAYAEIGHGLDSARLTAIEDLAEIELRLGRHGHVVDRLLDLAKANLMRGRLVASLMRALHLVGRSAEALLAFADHQRWLRDELGIDPSDELQQLHLEILRSTSARSDMGGDDVAGVDPSKARDPARTGTAEPAAEFPLAVPCTLPPDISDFFGRAAEVDHLSKQLTRQAGPTVVVVTGTAGVGKTALSTHVAYKLRSQFPGGQLFSDLHGFDGERPAQPVDILGRFLRALGVDGLALPANVDERAELYRNLLFERRVLIVLDNAANEKQILPLIPGGSGCSVIINSRAHLGASLGAVMLRLRALEQSDSVGLLAAVAGEDKVRTDESAARDLVELCGHLPLALRVAGAKFATRSHQSLRRFTDVLANERRRLDNLTHGHLDVRASIAISYNGLSGGAQMLLRRLPEIEAPEISIWVAAALTDTEYTAADELLEELCAAHLVEFSGRDAMGDPRYRLHDLVWLFAAEAGESMEPTEVRAAARSRLYGASLFLADTMYCALHGGDFLNTRSHSPRRPQDRRLTAYAAADPLNWFEVERPVIVALIRRAARDGQAEVCWDLACTLSPMFQASRSYDDWWTILQEARAVTEHAGEARGRAAVLYRMGMVRTDRQEYEPARRDFSEALGIFQEVGDDRGVAIATAFLAMVDRFQGSDEAALRQYESALAAFNELGDHGGAALASRAIGQIHLTRGRYAASADAFDWALGTYRKIGARQGMAQAQFWQAMLQLQLGHVEGAQTGFTEVLRMTRELRDATGEAQALRGLGLCYQRLGDNDEARRTLLKALRIVRQPQEGLLERFIRQELADL
ncbi:MAG: BTAD domain-containing putative transcriptional regulator [Micromonosporaceae bacterium]